MHTWLLTCSTDAVGVDYEEIIRSDDEPDFWTCYEIAAAHDCPFFTCEKI